eukprot:scpid109973/ scgid34457/ 
MSYPAECRPNVSLLTNCSPTHIVENPITDLRQERLGNALSWTGVVHAVSPALSSSSKQHRGPVDACLEADGAGNKNVSALARTSGMLSMTGAISTRHACNECAFPR